MTNIINALPDAFNMLSESRNNSGAVKLYGEVLKLFTENNASPSDSGVAAPADAQTIATLESAESSETQGVMNGMQSPDKTALAGNENGSLPAQGEILSPAGETFMQGDKAISQPDMAAQDQPLQNSTIINENADKGGTQQGANVQNAENMALNQEQVNALPKGASSEKTFSPTFLDNLRNLNVSENAIESLGKNPGMLFKELLSQFEEAPLSNPVEMAAWKKLFSSDEYNKLLKDTIESQWLLKPDDVEKKENIQNFYERLGKEAKALANVVNNSPLAGTSLVQSANNLSNNLDFMNQLNQMFQYIQLPLQMNSQNAHGDLYVYQNKHRKLSEDGSVSAVLHLDMENLGPVDVFVKLLDTKVTTNFYVMDDSTLSLINENIHILDERLEKRGYSLQVNLKLHDDDDGQDAALDEMLSVSRTTILSTASFDALA